MSSQFTESIVEEASFCFRKDGSEPPHVGCYEEWPRCRRYPPDLEAKATQTVLDQATLLCADSAANNGGGSARSAMVSVTTT